MRKPLIAANWKMNLDLNSGVQLAQALASETKNLSDRDVLICPPAPLLSDVGRALKGSPVKLGAQNMYYERSGAFTGEVSGAMLTSAGCTHVLLGHSERRHVFGEGDEYINKKVHSALEQELVPVLCVGELLEERDSGDTEKIIQRQISQGLDQVKAIDRVVIAYEPVWAIGTGKTATPDDADSVHEFIRGLIGKLYSDAAAEGLVILYGGSVKPDNIDGLMGRRSIDGVLVGGASLKADSFARIIKYQ